jgi:hypothetical protein
MNFEPKVGHCTAVNENLNVKLPELILEKEVAFERAVVAKERTCLSSRHSF